MKAVEKHVYLRKGYYYYRSVIPRQFRPILFFNELVIGLSTQDLTIARMNAAQIHYEFSTLFKQFQHDLATLSPDQSPDIAIDQLLKEISRVKEAFGYEPPKKYNHFKKALKQEHRLLFSTVVQEYLNDCSSDTHGTRFHKENTYELFTQLMGDMPFRDVGINEAKRFKSQLMKIPANAKKTYNIESFENADLDKLKGKSQHPKTINNRLAYLIALFNWAIRTDYYHGSNPFSNLKIQGKKAKGAIRHPFKPEELKILFNSPLCRNPKQPSLFWVPLIGLYSGMRLNEICQLYVKDIRQEEGIYIFDVNDDEEDKGLKTTSSRRKVPIHHELIKRGFLAYVEDIKTQKHKRLFPDIPMGVSAKTYSSTFTKRFWRLLKTLEIKRDGLCFHSLRHTFIDTMRNSGVERSIVMALTGHQSSKDVHDHYGYGYNLQTLQQNVNKLTYLLPEE